MTTQAVRMAKLVSMLVDGNGISQESGAAALRESDGARVRECLSALHDAGLVHIVDWKRSAHGPWFQVYAWCWNGRMPDVPRPKHARARHCEVPA